MAFVLAALIGGLCSIVVALIASRRGKATLAELRPNGGSSMRDLLDRVAAQQIKTSETIERIATEQAHVKAELSDFRKASESEKDSAKEEAIRMWRAIEAVAKAEPPLP